MLLLRNNLIKFNKNKLLINTTFNINNIRMSYATLPFKIGQTPTLSLQSTLPKLPIPLLELSLNRYLNSLKPLLLQSTLNQGKSLDNVEKELEIRRNWIKDFLKKDGLGLTLQQRLKDVDKSSPNNWLDDTFWLKNAYHSWRVPLIINSNWWILIADDIGIPEKVRNSIPNEGEFTEFQIKRASKLVERLIQFKLKLDNEQILPDASRAGPFCMHQYTRVFGLTRLPQIPIDTLAHAPHPHPSTYIIVIANDNYYKLPVLSSTQEPLSISELETSIWAIAQDASTREHGAGVGVCSGIGRDEWTLAREELLKSNLNQLTLIEIEQSLFVLSLDSHTLKSNQFITSSPINQTPDLDAHILNSCSGGGLGKNRWWDKGISIHVESNGRAGMVGEHSPCDALIPSIVCEYVLAEGIDQTQNQLSMKGKNNHKVERLEWEINSITSENISKAIRVVDELVKDSDAKMLWYDEYGVDWIKKVGKHSPDAYLQMALQLAYYKSHGVAVPTYETASTRMFKHGRTDVIRTLSSDSFTWVNAMMNKDQYDSKQLYSLLTAATQAHNTYTKDSSTGKGCDRHFMGLKLLMKSNESHPLFDDPLFNQSQAWILSTSGLSAGDKFYGTGFGTVWPEGYGINYLAGKSIIKFGIESKYSSPESSTTLFRQNLIEAMREMRTVCEQGQEEVVVGSKL